jgi:hypothetical protein
MNEIVVRLGLALTRDRTSWARRAPHTSTPAHTAVHTRLHADAHMPAVLGPQGGGGRGGGEGGGVALTKAQDFMGQARTTHIHTCGRRSAHQA